MSWLSYRTKKDRVKVLSLRPLIVAVSIYTTLLLICVARPLSAQSRSNLLYPDADPRGAPEITICTQNLENYGKFPLVRTRMRMDLGTFEEKEDALIRRFQRAKCDLLILQEVLAPSEIEAKEVLTVLADKLKKRTNREFEVSSGPSNDSMLRQGFLVARDRAEIMTKVSYEKIELPKISSKDPPALFSRGPLELQLRVNGRDGAHPKNLIVVNIHFKSKRGGGEDPAQLEWETHRMQMAEAIRIIVDTRHARSFATGKSILIVAGDRNSNRDSASAKILEGVLKLSRFQGDGLCRLSKRGVPLCKARSSSPQTLFSVLTLDPQTKHLPGTHRYKKEYSWLDDILMPAESLPFAWVDRNTEGDYDSGVVYDPKEASDHAMAWVRLNW